MESKLLSICGSPRKGNTEFMLTELNRLAKAGGMQSKLILLRQPENQALQGLPGL